MLKELHLKGVGPTQQFDVVFGERLNLFTGDNGLGKTFLLDVAWWALSGTWAENPILPVKRGATIRFQREGQEIPTLYEYQGNWIPIPDQNIFSDTLPPSLIIYVHADGCFSVGDQARRENSFSFPLKFPVVFGKNVQSGLYQFSPDTLWGGLRDNGKTLCNGLIDDWVRWQYQPEQTKQSPFQILKKILAQLSPPQPEERMFPGKPTRVSLDDVRDIPTIELPYGTIPVTQASAGMKRILGLAYLLVWAWYEHTQASKLLEQKPASHLLFVIDEVEAHLHPRWQRSILPAILEVAKTLDPKIQTQIIATTHSPLVLASVEPHFNEETDRLFLFDLKEKAVTLEQIPWVKQGDAVGWLTSEIFGLDQARSREAETAIEAAEAFMRGDKSKIPPHLQTKQQIHQELLRLLPGHDPFWPRWLVEAKLIPSQA